MLQIKFQAIFRSTELKATKRKNEDENGEKICIFGKPHTNKQ